MSPQAIVTRVFAGGFYDRRAEHLARQ